MKIIIMPNNNSPQRGSVKTQVVGKFNRDDLPRCLYNEIGWQINIVFQSRLSPDDDGNEPTPQLSNDSLRVVFKS